MKPLSMSILKLTMSVVHAIYMLIDSTMNELYGNSLLVLQLLRSISHSVEIIHLYTILLFGWDSLVAMEGRHKMSQLDIIYSLNRVWYNKQYICFHRKPVHVCIYMKQLYIMLHWHRVFTFPELISSGIDWGLRFSFSSLNVVRGCSNGQDGDSVTISLVSTTSSQSISAMFTSGRTLKCPTLELGPTNGLDGGVSSDAPKKSWWEFGVPLPLTFRINGLGGGVVPKKSCAPFDLWDMDCTLDLRRGRELTLSESERPKEYEDEMLDESVVDGDVEPLSSPILADRSRTLECVDIFNVSMEWGYVWIVAKAMQWAGVRVR